MTNDASRAEPRRLGADGPTVSAMGMGCWPIGGLVTYQGRLQGWPDVDPEESVRALRRGFDLGVTFFDTADMYGAGLSERLIGRALGDVRDEVVISTKVGFPFDEPAKVKYDANLDPAYIRRACEDSLRRFGTDHLDLYLCHINACTPEDAPAVLEVLEELVAAGKTRAIGWSTDERPLAEVCTESPSCGAIEHCFSVFARNAEVLELCEQRGLGAIAHSPLAAGLLGGAVAPGDPFEDGDIRIWIGEQPGGEHKVRDWLRQLDAIREVLTSDGRTVAQGAISWLWARSPALVPVPGFRSVAEAEENAGALRFGPLSPAQMSQLDELLAPAPTDWIPFTSHAQETTAA